MNVETIKRILNRRPFRPVELLVDGGEKVVIRHPEAVLVGRQLIMIELPDGSGDYVEAQHVSKVRVLSRRGNPSRSD